MADNAAAMSCLKQTLNLWYIQINFKTYNFSWTTKNIFFESGLTEDHTLGKVLVEIWAQNIK